jgi:ketosteroid isomerase-like protein
VTDLHHDEKKEVMELERRFIDACLRADTEVLDTIMADGFIFTDPKGLNLTKAEWLADLRSGAFRFESINVGDIRVNVSGDLASVTVNLRVTAKSKKAGYSGEYSAMDIYERRGGNWKITLSTANQVKAE